MPEHDSPTQPPVGGAPDPLLLHMLRDQADQLREVALGAGLDHARLRHQLAAQTLRTRWPNATVIEAALYGDRNPDIWGVLDHDEHRLWQRQPGAEVDGVIQEVERDLSIALDFADLTRAGWVRVTLLGVGFHRLTLPPQANEEQGSGSAEAAAEELPPWKPTRRTDGGWPWSSRRRR